MQPLTGSALGRNSALAIFRGRALTHGHKRRPHLAAGLSLFALIGGLFAPLFRPERSARAEPKHPDPRTEAARRLECLKRAQAIIARAYPEGGEVLAYTGSPVALGPLLSCRTEGELLARLPNLMHEAVHIAALRILGLPSNFVVREQLGIGQGPKQARKVEVTHLPVWDRGRDVRVAVFLGPGRLLTLRGFRMPALEQIRDAVPRDSRDLPSFQIYLSDRSRRGVFPLLDELHAYTHELRLVTALYPRTFRDWNTRTIQKDNVAAVELMILLYLKHLRQKDGAAYAELRERQDLISLMRFLFRRADAALARVADEDRYDQLRHHWPQLVDHLDSHREELSRLFERP